VIAVMLVLCRYRTWFTVLAGYFGVHSCLLHYFIFLSLSIQRIVAALPCCGYYEDGILGGIHVVAHRHDGSVGLHWVQVLQLGCMQHGAMLLLKIRRLLSSTRFPVDVPEPWL
jgi:hypothetical protein